MHKGWKNVISLLWQLHAFCNIFQAIVGIYDKHFLPFFFMAHSNQKPISIGAIFCHKHIILYISILTYMGMHSGEITS